jgi:hypothetical protein
VQDWYIPLNPALGLGFGAALGPGSAFAESDRWREPTNIGFTFIIIDFNVHLTVSTGPMMWGPDSGVRTPESDT